MARSALSVVIDILERWLCGLGDWKPSRCHGEAVGLDSSLDPVSQMPALPVYRSGSEVISLKNE